MNVPQKGFVKVIKVCIYNVIEQQIKRKFQTTKFY
jgi:hypothetical protein